MKYFRVLLVVFFVSCNLTKEDKGHLNQFTESDKLVLESATEVIAQSSFVSLISVDQQGQPRARVMEFFQPDKAFVFWLGTNPKSRKVEQIKQNSKVTLHFFDQSKMAYVSLMGRAYIVEDNAIKAKKFKKGWEQFYKNKTTDFTLIQFVPNDLEYIGILKGFTGDKVTWAPHKVVLRE
jgi:general stress protein 26